jgi:predicted ATPase
LVFVPSSLRARKDRTAPGRTSGGGGGICFRSEDRRTDRESILHHVKGELLLAQNPSDGVEAEQCFRTAIQIARRQSARIAELRAATSLARLLAKQGRRDEAHTMLAEIYGWFTEGFHTADLRDAKALLDKLNE